MGMRMGRGMGMGMGVWVWVYGYGYGARGKGMSILEGGTAVDGSARRKARLLGGCAEQLGIAEIDRSELRGGRR